MQLIRHGGRCIISCATDVSPAGTNGWLPSARHNRTTREPLPGAKQPMEIPCLWKLYSDARHPCQIFRPVHWPTRGAHCRPLDPRLASSLLKFLHKCKSRKRGLDTSAVMGGNLFVHRGYPKFTFPSQQPRGPFGPRSGQSLRKAIGCHYIRQKRRSRTAACVLPPLLNGHPALSRSPWLLTNRLPFHDNLLLMFRPSKRNLESVRSRPA